MQRVESARPSLSWLRGPMCAGALVFAPMFASTAAATDVARTPFTTQASGRPNVIFGMVDSQSMDSEVLMRGTRDGLLYWNTDPAVLSAWAAGVPNAGGGLPGYQYLFPDGCTPAGRKQACDGDGHWAIAPSMQLAALRSSAYNALYYDPAQTYQPWAPGTVDGTLRSWTDANPHAAPLHPLYPATMPLDADFTSTAADTTFHMIAGMTVPTGASTLDAVGNAWVPVAWSFDVPAGTTYTMSMTYYPATYWLKAACSPNYTDCAAAPDGATLKRYEIKPGTVFPSGRSYAAEMQNFANWFTYHRRRRFALGAAVSNVMNSVGGIRAGVVDFNARAPVTMYDTDVADPTANGRMIAGHFQGNTASGTTPAREALAYIGDQFRRNTQVITASCQSNAAVIVTDSYSPPTPTTPPYYDSYAYGWDSPYGGTWRNSLADIAMAYYTINLRPDLAAGQVPVAAANDPYPGADRNPNLHMRTYAIALGTSGNLWPARSDAFVGVPIVWPDPAEVASPKSIDDLWHATLNGRGRMSTAGDASSTTVALRSVLANIANATSARSGVAFGNPTLSASDAVAFLGTYRSATWSGDIAAHAVDAGTGTIAPAALWSANTSLTARDWHGRTVIGFDGTRGVDFTAATFGEALAPGATPAAKSMLVDYLRGDRSNEASTYRARSGLLGPDIAAEPVVDRALGVVYGVTNEGMVHALDKATGAELWAYVPGFALADVAAQARPAWQSASMLDATPVLATAGLRKLLVGGRGSAGTGFYALDVGAGTPSNRALWEFPNATSASPQSTADLVRTSLGASIGKPVIVRSATWGWVVLVTSGYNSTRDGRGRLFVLDAVTGAVRSEIATTAGTVGAGDAGLAQVSAFVESGGMVRRVYGGDLLGNLWRFDIDAGTVQRLATLADAQGLPLPITAAPELGIDGPRRMVYVGTGRLLGTSDLADARVNTMFAIRDDDSIGADLRSQLAPRVLTPTGSLRHVSGIAVDWATQRGWYVDMPAGEKAHTDPSLALGILTWTANQTSLNACLSSSVLYAADASSGLELPARSFPAEAWYGIALSPALTSRPSLARLSDGNIVIATQQSDGLTTQHKLLTPAASAPRKGAWKENRSPPTL